MINLLSDGKKSEIRAGQLNTHFMSFILMVFAALILVAALGGLSYAVLINTNDAAQKREAEGRVKLSNYAEQEKAVKEFAQDLTNAEKITNVQARYSQIFIGVGNALPTDAIIKELEINPSNITEGLTMEVYSKEEKSMIAVKNNLLKNKKIFADASFKKVDFSKCDPPDVKDKQYKCVATLNVILNKDVLSFGQDLEAKK